MFRLPKHAEEAVEKRNLSLDWIDRAIAAPDFTNADPHITPAMAAGVTTKLWSIADMVKVIEDRETLRDGTRLVG